MEVAATPIILHPRLFILNKPNKPCTTLLRIQKLSSTNDTNNSTTNTSSSDTSTTPSSELLDSVEIRFKRGSRRRYKEDMDGSRAAAVVKKKDPPKKWEEMSIGEKAMEVYVGEKGVLFWLNKFAYASIFIMIGIWILFRFVGPALNLYQLDAPPLAPTSVFKGA